MVKGLILGVFLAAGSAVAAQETSDRVNYVSCAVCHGAGEGAGAIPAIDGRPRQELLEALTAFAAAPDGSTIMHRFAVGLTAAELEGLARHIASQKDPAR